MSGMIERLKARHGIAKNSPTMARAKVLASNDLEMLADLVALRKERGLSQQDVADLIGVSQATIAAFERPGNDPKLSTIRRYAHAVGVLVAHKTALDEGQLFTDFRRDWDAADKRRSSMTISATVTYPVFHREPIHVASEYFRAALVVAA